jgi:hypothetical protein
MVRMTRAFLGAMGGLVAFLLASAVAPATGAAGTMNPPRDEGGADSVLDRLADGLPGISFGLGVSPLRSQFGLEAPQAATGVQGGEPAGLLDPEGRALSFDLKLGWPGTDKLSLLEPYVKLGPALFIVEPDYVSRLVGTRSDPAYRLGAKAGAGVNLHLGKNAELFSAYEITSPSPTAVPPLGAKTPAETGISGYDFTYGLRLRY